MFTEQNIQYLFLSVYPHSPVTSVYMSLLPSLCPFCLRSVVLLPHLQYEGSMFSPLSYSRHFSQIFPTMVFHFNLKSVPGSLWQCSRFLKKTPRYLLRPNVSVRWRSVSSNSLNYLTNSTPPDPMPSTPFNLNSFLSKAECLSMRLNTDDTPLGTSWSGVHMKNYPSPHPGNKTMYSLEIFVKNVLLNVLFCMTQKAGLPDDRTTPDAEQSSCEKRN